MEIPPEWDMLLSAAQKNRPDLIAEMIETGGVNPSHSNGVGQSAVHIAALWGHHESLEALVSRGASVNAQNNLSGATPLHMVAQSLKSTVGRRLRCAELLVAHGARVDQRDHFGLLPVEVLQQVIGDKGMVDELNQQLISTLQPTRPAIHEAIETRNVDQLQAILCEDASQSNLTYQSESPIEIVVDALIQQGDEGAGNSEVLIEILDLLLKHGGNTSGVESIRKTTVADPGDVKEPPLHKLLCALRRYLSSQQESTDDTGTRACLEKAIDMLVQAGATLTSDSAQLLLQAARFGELAFARYLIERLHVDVNVKGRQGMTPLQFAARSGKMEILVSCNQNDICGVRPFHSFGITDPTIVGSSHFSTLAESSSEPAGDRYSCQRRPR